jgi:hypothetical protein
MWMPPNAILAKAQQKRGRVVRLAWIKRGGEHGKATRAAHNPAELLASRGRPLTRGEALAAYRQIRAAIQRVLREAVRACSRADLTRAARQLGLWQEGQIAADEDALDMLVDVALFEPNQRGRRAFDRFLADGVLRLAPADLELAQRMAGAFFSIFRFAARHETAGVWLEDLLEGERRLWLIDEALEASAPDGVVFGMRLFDAGPFHAGFGIIVPADEETIDLCVEARSRGARLPFRYSLAATLYGDSIRAGIPPDERLIDTLLELLPSGWNLPNDTDSPAERPTPPSRKRRPKG